LPLHRSATKGRSNWAIAVHLYIGSTPNPLRADVTWDGKDQTAVRGEDVSDERTSEVLAVGTDNGLRAHLVRAVASSIVGIFQPNERCSKFSLSRSDPLAVARTLVVRAGVGNDSAVGGHQ
jgi:hypothetical protein